MAEKGLPVVLEGKRINLRVFRRFFYPLQIKHRGEKFIVYSDTRREREINYKRPEDYDLDNPFNRIKLIRLARAMNCLKQSQEKENEYRITLCTNKELYYPQAETIRYIPFDPRRLDPLKERIEEGRRKIEWGQKFIPRR